MVWVTAEVDRSGLARRGASMPRTCENSRSRSPWERYRNPGRGRRDPGQSCRNPRHPPSRSSRRDHPRRPMIRPGQHTASSHADLVGSLGSPAVRPRGMGVARGTDHRSGWRFSTTCRPARPPSPRRRHIIRACTTVWHPRAHPMPMRLSALWVGRMPLTPRAGLTSAHPLARACVVRNATRTPHHPPPHAHTHAQSRRSYRSRALRGAASGRPSKVGLALR